MATFSREISKAMKREAERTMKCSILVRGGGGEVERTFGT